MSQPLYDRVQQATVDALRSFDADATERVVRERSERVALCAQLHTTGVFRCLLVHCRGTAHSLCPGPGDEVAWTRSEPLRGR